MDNKDFYGITIFSSESFSLPWIWYKFSESTGMRGLQLTHINNDLIGKSASEIIQELAPNYPNLHNIANSTQYSDIYEIEVYFANHSETVALIEKTYENRNFMFFVYGNVLARLAIYDNEDFDFVSFAKDFSLKKVSIDIDKNASTNQNKIADLIKMIKYQAGNLTLSNAQKLKYDYNSDGVINAVDFSIAKRNVLNLV
ncbi:hypothetical protein FACS1894132_07000 [Clostridia bacterium]|nr:hypothetical protein FACS1894132_07000 [Clostridia bacterium]